MSKTGWVMIYNIILLALTGYVFYLTRSGWSFLLLLAFTTIHEEAK